MLEIVNCPGLLLPPYGSIGHAREAWMVDPYGGILPDGEEIAFA